MSWFKRNRGSNSSNEPSPSKDRSNTDPDTCLDVFRSHWQQASAIINNKSRNKDDFSSDEVEIVIHNIGQMVTLLISEDGEEGMPGPILNFFLEKDILELFCSWCSRSREHAVKLKHEQLRMFEMLISQSKQLLLIHKSVIRPLLKLLSACTDGNLQSSDTYDIEHRLVLVLHQACVCISQQFLILESFFCTHTDHGPTRFLLFSLLIPYVHREGPVGQHARDALLLIMTMSTKHPHIGQYIASNSDFCPVLAAGLSGLYSSLPRKIPNPSENWYMLTNDDCQAIPELQMFLNSLEFCNAVVQIAHPMVKEQLIKYIYDGFLLPVLGPALHQDISGLPIPLLDTTMFSNSRDEVTTATAYLDLFLRRLTEPALIRVFLLFILTERNDEIIILDSLITRINSSTRLSLVSLALFKTLVELHCEDVMFQLVFKYLIPCTHVMVSQRRAVKDLDMYSKSAERFLSLRPSCCLGDADNSIHNTTVTTSQSLIETRLGKGDNSHHSKSPSVVKGDNSHPLNSRSANNVTQSRLSSFTSFFRRGSANKLRRSQSMAVASVANKGSSKNDSTLHSEDVKNPETGYMDYLHDAQRKLEKCAVDCKCWSAPYNGENPSPDSLMDSAEHSKESENTNQSENSPRSPSADASNETLDSTTTNEDGRPYPQVKLFEQEIENLAMKKFENDSLFFSQGKKCDFNKNDSHSLLDCDSTLSSEQCNSFLGTSENTSLSNLYCSLKSRDCFLTFLNIIDDSKSDDSMEQTMETIDFMYSSFGVPLNRGAAELGDSIEMESPAASPEQLKPEPRAVSPQITNSTPYEMIEVSTNNFNPETTSTPSANRLKDISSYVEITISGDNKSTNDMTKIQPKSAVPNRAMSPVMDGTLSPFNFNKTSEDISFSLAQSPGGTLLTTSRYSSGTPNIGPFLSALFCKLEGMMQNTLYSNLLLTGILSQLATYPQPLLRSFLLNHNLVFQPTVKSLVQVLSSVRHKVDTYSYAVNNFSQLLTKARKNLYNREDSILNRSERSFSTPVPVHSSPVQTIQTVHLPNDTPSKEKRRMTFTDLLFRKNSPKRPSTLASTKKGTQLQRVPLRGGVGYRYINSKQTESPDSPEGTLKTWNAVYCAIVLEEFLKELAALAQEHAVLHFEDSFNCRH